MLRIWFCLAASLALPAQDGTHSSGWVVIPVSEYSALRARAYPVDREPDPASEATLSRVDYDLRVTGDIAIGRATLTIDVLKSGWVRVPIPDGLIVREARLDGKPVSLASSPVAAVISKPGRAILTLEMGVPVSGSPAGRQLTLPHSTAGVTRLAVTLPRQDVPVGVTGGIFSGQSDTAAETKYLAYGLGNESLHFYWSRKIEDHRADQPLRLRGSLTELLALGEDSTSVYAEVNLEVAQGSARQVRLRVPSTVTVNQVPGAAVADWEVKAGALTVTFLDPVSTTARFVVSGESRLPRDGSIDLPLLELLDTERESGGVAVEVAGAGEIKDLQAQGLDRVDAAALGQTVAQRQSPSLVAFRFRPGTQSSARALTVQVARYQQQAVLTANIEEARYRILLSVEGKALVQAVYSVRNNQSNFVRITLPAGALVWSASLAGRPVRPGQSPDGSLLFPLAKTRAAGDAAPFPIEVLYLARSPAWTEKGRAKLPLPTLDLPISRTGLLVYHPPAFRITPEPGAFRAQDYEKPASDILTAGAAPPPADENRNAAPQQNINASQSAAQMATQAATQALVDKFRARAEARRPPAAPPVRISFPAVGPSLYLVSELTGENQSPAVELNYQKDRKAGVK